jgi:kumamolisin
LSVDHVDNARRGVWLSGTVEKFSRAFKVSLVHYQLEGKKFRTRVGVLQIPRSLEGIILSVDGLTHEPSAKPHVRQAQFQPHDLSSSSQGFSVLDVANRYNFPPDATGKGQTIGIVALGGGYNADEIASYFSQIALTTPVSFSDAQFYGQGTNAQVTGSKADLEIALDIEIAGSVAPAAKILVYFAPDTSNQGFLDALSAAVNDPNNHLNIISISWGWPESEWKEALKDQFDEILKDAANQNITVCVASGDNGSSDYDSTDLSDNGQANVDFPSSNPYVLACGGTQLVGGLDPTQAEVVWGFGRQDGTGGGVSRDYPLPDYQANAGVPPAANPPGPIMRGVPDVSGDAAPESGYNILFDGSWGTYGGTSAVAPLWAGLIARLNEKFGRPLGFVNPALYQIGSGSPAFNDIVTGSNGDYSASKDWDACTGLGTPNGIQLEQALSGQTPSPDARVAMTNLGKIDQDDPRLAILSQYLALTEKLISALYPNEPPNSSSLPPKTP